MAVIDQIKNILRALVRPSPTAVSPEPSAELEREQERKRGMRGGGML